MRLSLVAPTDSERSASESARALLCHSGDLFGHAAAKAAEAWVHEATCFSARAKLDLLALVATRVGCDLATLTHFAPLHEPGHASSDDRDWTGNADRRGAALRFLERLLLRPEGVDVGTVERAWEHGLRSDELTALVFLATIFGALATVVTALDAETPLH